MLVVSRKQGEEVVIGGDVRVKVVEVSGNRVRLAFCAPRDILIRRSELCPVPAELSDDEFSLVLVEA